MNNLHLIPSLSIVGNKGVGKNKIIQNIINGQILHPSLPTLSSTTQIIKINNTIYKYKYKRQFYNYKNQNNLHFLSKAYIVVDPTSSLSIDSITQWYTLLHLQQSYNDITIIINNKGQQLHLQLFHHIIHFCSTKHLKLININ